MTNAEADGTLANSDGLKVDHQRIIATVRREETLDISEEDVLAEVAAANFQHDLLISFK